jgi:hypothetical protein
MFLQDDIASLLRRKHIYPYCDDCLREAIASMRDEEAISIDEVRRETENLKGHWGFHAGEHTICMRCGQRKSTIMAL